MPVGLQADGQALRQTYGVAGHGVDSVVLRCWWEQGKKPEVCFWIVREWYELLADPETWFVGV